MHPTHQTQKPFYIIPLRQKNPASQENYTFKLHLVMILRLSFKSGSDLLLTNGQAWAHPLYTLSKYHLDLYEKLREDGLVSDNLDTVGLRVVPLVL